MLLKVAAEAMNEKCTCYLGFYQNKACYLGEYMWHVTSQNLVTVDGEA